MECLSYCIANSIDLTKLDNQLKSLFTNFNFTKSRDQLKLSHNDDPSILIFIFKNGTVVSWGIKRYQIKIYLKTIKSLVHRPFSFQVHDEFSFVIGDRTAIEPHEFFDVDCLTLDSDTDDLKLSMSYGFSQSVKLQYFEMTLEALIEKYTPFIRMTSTKTKKMATKNQVRQIIGEIIAAKSEMNLISNFLYHPKFFWQHPTLEEYYIMLERYLHIQRRVNAINHRLDTLNEIFNMFNGYLENRHSHNLEIIIIVLIAIEIIFGVVNFHF